MRRKINALLLSLSLGLTAITCTLPASGVIAAEADTTGVTMYRLYNPNSGEHFYTKDASEKNNLVKAGWSDEGIGWIAPEKSDTPVYRLYNANAGDHHYTMNAKERDELVSAGWKSEDIGWYSDDAETVPLYREYNPNAVSGTHNYTTDKVEHDNLVKAGWKDEGIGWYGIVQEIEPLFPNAKIGDIVTLGTYEQDNNFENGPEPIQWQYVADKDGHKLLLSKYVLDRKLYNDEDAKVTWETCTLRAWLNNDFYNTAFSPYDKQSIVIAHNENPDSFELFKGWGQENRGEYGGNATDDRVFLLSWTEARDYFDGKLFNYMEPPEKNIEYNYNQKLICKPTTYAEAQGIGVYNRHYEYDPSDMIGCCRWWLRSPGAGPESDDSSGASIVIFNGSLNSAPAYFPEEWDSAKYGVRPALLID